MAGSSDPKLQELLDQGAATTDQAERAEAYQAAELYIMQQAYEIPMFHRGGLDVFQPKVRNVVRGYTTCLAANWLEPPIYIQK
jgi:ABC-type oligopeptide transport system substrate-binding subunit